MTELLPFVPEQDGYGVTHPNQVVQIALDGGPPRMRADSLGMSSRVSASWLLDRLEYTRFLQFWRVNLQLGALPCLVDLVTGLYQVARHKATFVPGSLRTTQVAGLTYRVSAEFLAEPLQLITSSAGGGFRFQYPASVLYPGTPARSFVELFAAGDRLQILGAQESNGANPAIDLDGIYTVSAVVDDNELSLVSPEADNPDWLLLDAYASDHSSNLTTATIVLSPV
jgi:hypothetical protein